MGKEGIGIGNLIESSHYLSTTVSTSSAAVLLEHMPSIVHRFEHTTLSSPYW